MKHVQVLSTLLIVLAVSRATGVQAQQDDRRQKQDQSQRVSPEEQQRRVQQEQDRTTRYQRQLPQQVHTIHESAAQLQQQNRNAQYQAQQDYEARLREQQQRLQTARDYSNDPYTYTPHNYGYSVNGSARQTNQYGADVLRQAVSNGYELGVRGGQADRQDGWRSNYQGSAVYRDANYGYTGNYVDQADYNYYFRQGFQRGYQDGYNNRSQYGNTSNGSILGNVLSSILGLVSR